MSMTIAIPDCILRNGLLSGHPDLVQQHETYGGLTIPISRAVAEKCTVLAAQLNVAAEDYPTLTDIELRNWVARVHTASSKEEDVANILSAGTAAQGRRRQRPPPVITRTEFEEPLRPVPPVSRWSPPTSEVDPSEYGEEEAEDSDDDNEDLLGDHGSLDGSPLTLGQMPMGVARSTSTGYTAVVPEPHNPDMDHVVELGRQLGLNMEASMLKMVAEVNQYGREQLRVNMAAAVRDGRELDDAQFSFLAMQLKGMDSKLTGIQGCLDMLERGGSENKKSDKKSDKTNNKTFSQVTIVQSGTHGASCGWKEWRKKFKAKRSAPAAELHPIPRTPARAPTPLSQPVWIAPRPVPPVPTLPAPTTDPAQEVPPLGFRWASPPTVLEAASPRNTLMVPLQTFREMPVEETKWKQTDGQEGTKSYTATNYSMRPGTLDFDREAVKWFHLHGFRYSICGDKEDPTLHTPTPSQHQNLAEMVGSRINREFGRRGGVALV